jgi:hypothetical protein
MGSAMAHPPCALMAIIGVLQLCGGSTAAAQVGPAPDPVAQPPADLPVIAGRPERGGGPATAPNDPYPLAAAGWGAPVGPERFMVRWVEDWSRLKAQAPALKAIPLGEQVSLSLSGEFRDRNEFYGNFNLTKSDNFSQALFRGIVGADLRVGEHIRFYGELGAARLTGHRFAAIPLFKNDIALQQAFGEARTMVGSSLIGVMAGRQEFADGPRQLLSVGDGASLHRTWNGVRAYLHAPRVRLGAFAFDLTEPQPGAFDDHATTAERLAGANASLLLADGPGNQDSFLDFYYYHSRNDRMRWGPTLGQDRRDTFALRYWGQHGPVTYDLMAVRQSGSYEDRSVRAWGVFGIANVLLGESGWRPRIGGHVDIASGGGAFDSTGTLRSFNQLYANSAHLSEGLLLSSTNLAVISPALMLAPSKRVNITSELSFIRRLDQRDAVYAGLERAYAGTAQVRGHDVGKLARITAIWNATSNIVVMANAERLFGGQVFRSAGRSSTNFGMLSFQYRY